MLRLCINRRGAIVLKNEIFTKLADAASIRAASLAIIHHHRCLFFKMIGEGRGADMGMTQESNHEWTQNQILFT